ncbi:MAG: recombinase family protein [Oscillospiraceae bacterium]|nr:recombinase family protein [Oscillospiraceae bacterium]
MPEVKLISPITRQSIEKKRVAAYCRVSSNSADQQNSYATQIRVYTSLIQKRKEWELVEIFADEGLSGMKSDNRTEFQRMIQMCENHQIDIIITKSVSRFARNAKESLAYVRKLKLLGVGVQFEKEGIYTLALGDEMLLNTFSAIAQEESKAISQNQRLSIVKRMEGGEYVDSNAPYGFRLVNKELSIYEPEAEIVRTIFRLYLNGFSTSELARELNSRNIKTKTGKGIWRSAKVAYILGNEKYIGDCCYQKTYRDTTVPFKQYTNRGQEDQFYASGTHAPLIDKETFDKVQVLLKKRQDTFSKTTTQNIYPLTSRIQCSECGSYFRRRIVAGSIKWVCCRHISDSAACRSSYYSEERIYDGFIAMVNKLRFGEDNILGQVIARLESATVLYKKNNLAAREMSQSIAELNAKLLMLEQLRAKGYLAPEVHQAQTREINNQLASLKKERQTELDSQIIRMHGEVKHLKELLDELEDPLECFDEKLFTEIIKAITISHTDEMELTVLGGLKFTELI